MEALSRILSPFKETIGTLAAYLTIAQFFSGCFICLNIYKKKSTKDISAIPFVGGIMMGLSMLKYAFLLQDGVMLQVNVVAILLNACYTIFYYYYAEDKWNDLLKPLAYNMGFVAILWGYCEWENPALIEFRYGLIVTVIMLLLLGSPLVGLKSIIEKKDASQIPFVLTFMGTIVTFMWLLYAIIILNYFMVIQNVVGFILCSIQLGLILVYPGKPIDQTGKPIDKTKKKL